MTEVDMAEEEHLRDLMLAVDVPPTTADIGLAVATGRRQARRGTVLAGAATVLLAAAGTAYAFGVAPSGGSPDPQVGQPPAEGAYAACTVEAVDVASRAGRAVVDPAGRTIVGTVDGAVVRFDNGRAVPYAGATGYVVAVNDAGLIVGYDEADNAGHQLAWTYRGGTKTMLPKLPGSAYSFPTAVNARGDVAGAVMGEAGDNTIPVMWPADQPGTVRVLTTPVSFGSVGTGGSQATGLSDDGVVAGTVRGAPVLWSADGTPRLLRLPTGHEHGGVTAMRGGFVYGHAGVTGENRVVGLRWNLGTDDPATVLTGVSDEVAAATPDGWLITTGGDYNQPTRVNPRGIVERLPLPPGVLIPPNGPGGSATSISDDGRIITGAISSTGGSLLIWHC